MRWQLARLSQRTERHRAAAAQYAALLAPRKRAMGEGAYLRDLSLPAMASSLLEPDLEGQPAGEPYIDGSTLLGVQAEEGALEARMPMADPGRRCSRPR